MPDLSQSLFLAVELIFGFDPYLWGIILLSLQVSLSAVFCATIIGIPLGATVAITRFPGRQIIRLLLNSFMGLPPVVVGLLVYILLSRAGPLGDLGILFTPTAMVIAQTLLVTPIIAALTLHTISELHVEYREQLQSLAISTLKQIPTLLWEGRFSLVTAILAGFGRASAEVGAVLIVGGNIKHFTRLLTTSIAFETSKGNLVQAMALGITLISITILINLLVMLVRQMAEKYYC